ncbi:sulfatase-like hydrolase/transferase [Mucilaginibacter mali]|uniref:Sulfatase-like hydrolase/transferase n=2 Tax=Mucilaginibacter mali TaxID=2740462 RepID=A0A7D4UHE5_9SPHI|nr:sulfatase-like hydrolase/transferase [Mucilaginibacter mali]
MRKAGSAVFGFKFPKLGFIAGVLFLNALSVFSQQKPNVVIIYADDLGYGDLSCYGSKIIKTPNIDAVAKSGIRFTNAHSTSPTCTPSRFALMTGIYPWRQTGTGILPGDAKLIIPANHITLPKVFKKAGYYTALVGKWHLGLGDSVNKNWNGEIKPGPNEVGFDYSFIFPATADRVPTVFLENHYVIASDTNDRILVNYRKKVGNDPTGKENPELLKVKADPNQGHNNTIVNGIGRIGFMSGGYKARWVDEELTYTFVDKAGEVIKSHKKQPFLLCYNAIEPHVPRMPATQFKGKSGLGYRGDAILQLDWAVGQIVKYLRENKLEQNTLIIISSDNGPVLNDGYLDGASESYHGEQLGGLRGGKYSLLEGGTRLPFIVSWPGKLKSGVSDAMFSQVDLLASFAAMFDQAVPRNEAVDSENHLDALLGRNKSGRALLIEGNTKDKLAIVKGDWKYIPPGNGPALDKLVNIETGNSRDPQLFNLKTDPAERNNLARKYPEKVRELDQLLQAKLR